VSTEPPAVERSLSEYGALRATIRQRGSLRPCVFVAGLSAWALVTLATTLVTLPPVIAVIPLVVLAGTFEAVFGLHVAVERIGRYLQVFFDDDWERRAMAAGAPLAGTGADPLFAMTFALAALCNFIPVLLAGPVTAELVVIGGAHVLFGVRLAAARRAAGRQRAADLERFQLVRDSQLTTHNSQLRTHN
jgi:hypothetical protein